MSIFQRCIPLLLAVVLAGCGGSDLELGEVQGVVTLNGKPLPNAVVTFAPEGEGPSGVGKTNADGKYQLMSAGQLGAIPGQHTVSIICMPEPAPVKHVRSDDPGYLSGGKSSATYRPPPVPKVPARYNSQTELTKEVEAGTTNTIDFELKS